MHLTMLTAIQSWQKFILKNFGKKQNENIDYIAYISKQDKRAPPPLYASGILHLYTVVYAGKLCEQA